MTNQKANAGNAANVKFQPKENMDTIKLFSKDASTTQKTVFDDLPIKVTAIIEGNKKTIIPAYTNYSMEKPKNKKKLMESVDKSSMLDVIFHFATPGVFWDNGMTLFNSNGEAIDKDTADVFVFCDTADTYWRVFFDEELSNVVIHDFKSVEDYAKAIGNTTILSRGLNNIEKVGVAALATGDEAYKEVFEFAKSNSMPVSTAQSYLDIQLKPMTTYIMMLGKNPKNVPTLGRSIDEAQTLFEQIKLTFTPGGAKKRYAIRVVNNLLKDKKYSMDEVMECLQTIPSSDIVSTELSKCGDRELCIMGTLLGWLTNMKLNRKEQVA